MRNKVGLVYFLICQMSHKLSLKTKRYVPNLVMTAAKSTLQFHLFFLTSYFTVLSKFNHLNKLYFISLNLFQIQALFSPYLLSLISLQCTNLPQDLYEVKQGQYTQVENFA